MMKRNKGQTISMNNRTFHQRILVLAQITHVCEQHYGSYLLSLSDLEVLPDE